MARVLIAGCGYVGSALGRSLVARGDLVWGLRRDVAQLPAELRPFAADLTDRGTLHLLPAPLDALVYAAAPAGGDAASYRDVYERGLANLLDRVAAASREAGDSPPRVILLSSTSVYGQTAGEWVDEASPTEPADVRGRLVLRGEETLRASPCAGTALRLGGLYGPGRTSLIDAVREGRARLAPGPARFTNRIHRDDAARAIQHLLTLPAPESIYVGVDEEPADRNEVLRWLARRLGVAISAAGEDGEMSVRADADRAGAAGAGREPLSRESNKRCSSARLRATGYRFRYPSYREGYAALLG